MRSEEYSARPRASDSGSPLAAISGSLFTFHFSLFTTVLFALIAAALLLLGPANAADPADPMAPFKRLVGGEWHHGDTYQVFEWGVGRRNVRSFSYALVDGEYTLVSEGTWYWHPQENAFKGIFVAVGMGIDVFEYQTKFEDNTMVNKLKTFDADGNEEHHAETWEFIDENHYVWTLFSQTEDGPRKTMEGTFVRRPAADETDD